MGRVSVSICVSALSLLVLSSACGNDDGDDAGGSGASETSETSGTTGDGDPGDGDPGDGDPGDGDPGDGDPGDECPALDAYDVAADWAELGAGVTTVDFGGGAPSALIAHGAQAFPLAIDGDGDVMVAAARAGAGRVVVWGHENQLGGMLGAADNARLVENAASWAAGDAQSPVIGVAAELTMLGPQLEGAGMTVMSVGPDQLAGVDVYAFGASTVYAPAQVQAIADFVANGGGLLVAGQAWWWASQNPGAPLSSYPGNAALALADAGVLITDDAWAYDGQGAHFAAMAPTATSNPHHAIEALRGHWLGEANLAQPDLDAAFTSSQAAVESLEVPEHPDFFCRARAYAAIFGDIVPTLGVPLQPDLQPFEALALTVDVRVGTADTPALIEAHEAAPDFPGQPEANAPAIDLSVTVDASHAGRDPRFIYSGAGAPAWRSTGVYAPAGALIELEVPPALVDQGLLVQIGSHSDTLWDREDWTRVPALLRRDPIAAATTTSASAFGGLVYVVVPVGADLGSHEVTVRGGVAAPRYVHGVTDNATWQAEQRDLPGPWAELASDKFVMTVPSEAIRTLDDPEALMSLWDAVLDDQAMLAGIPADRPRAERFVLDRQISAGWMHSGYPIMAHLASTQELVDQAYIEQSGIWGPFHELGHNHQWREFVLPGTTEANVNLWSVHSSELVLGIARGDAHPALAPADRAQRISDYVNGGADFWANWNVWTALETYLQLQEAFGWQPLTDLHANYYYGLPADPAPGDQDKIDAFALQFGLLVDRDLGPFFLAWGFPLSQGVVDQLAALPVWAEDPMP